METKLSLTAVFQEAEEGGYIAFIEEIPGVNTQGETIEEARENLKDALHLLTSSYRELSEKELIGKHAIREKLILMSEKT